jgi:hypothetical protein
LQETLGFVRDLMPSRVDHRPAGNGQPLISVAVLLESGDGAVDTTAIRFDDQTRVAPEEVRDHRDPVDNQMAVDLEWVKATPSEQPQELFLELAAGVLFSGIVKLDGQSKSRNPSSALASLQQLDDFDQIEDLLDFRLGYGVTKGAGRLGGSYVEQSPSETGARNPIDHCAVG